MHLIYLAAGAGRMYCGACARDLALVRGLTALGHDTEVIPLYTPLRIEGEAPDGLRPVFLGGLNAFLQQHSRLFRRLPPADLGHGLDARAVLLLDGVAVDVQHHPDARIFFQILPHGGVAGRVAARIAGVVVQSLVVHGADAGRVQRGRDAPGAFIEHDRVGGAHALEVLLQDLGAVGRELDSLNGGVIGVAAPLLAGGQAQAEVHGNGFFKNGINFNGINFNGMQANGRSWQARTWQGRSYQARTWQSRAWQGRSVQGMQESGNLVTPTAVILTNGERVTLP